MTEQTISILSELAKHANGAPITALDNLAQRVYPRAHNPTFRLRTELISLADTGLVSISPRHYNDRGSKYAIAPRGLEVLRG
jgi:hypothetical protein